jgi:hypothetical protein
VKERMNICNIQVFNQSINQLKQCIKCMQIAITVFDITLARKLHVGIAKVALW